MKNITKKMTLWMTAFSLGLLAGGIDGQAWAASVEDTSSVTVNVAEVLSITDQFGDSTLTFNDFVSGSASTGQTVSYRVLANNMSNAAVPGALSAEISADLSGITIQANMGATAFQDAGTTGNAVLKPDATDGIIVGTTTTSLMSKPVSTDTQGKVLNGTAFVNWSANATRDLAASDGGVVTLKVTLKDT
jgi:hypothetical protein